MLKNKKVYLAIILILLLIIPCGVNAATKYSRIEWGKENPWIKFPSKIERSWIANWDGYYIYNGNLEKISTSDSITFEIQCLCIEEKYLSEIQAKSDETADDDIFYEWLNNYVVEFIKEENWEELTNMKIECECKLGQSEQHDHLIFIKVLENGVENIAWQGYGEGFTRIQESRKQATLESIEITTPPEKTVYKEGEIFDKSGMVVTAKYSDGTSKVVVDYTYTPQTALKISDTAVTITYTEDNISKEVIQKIEVKAETKDNPNDEEIKDNQNEEETNNQDDSKKIFKNHIYSIIEKNMTWEEAKVYCENLGGYLVTITSASEQEFIQSLIEEKGFTENRFWIGATDKEMEGTWKWVTGEKFDYSNWGENQPDNSDDGKRQNYAVLHGYDTTYHGYKVSVGQWDDVLNDENDRRNNIYFICEWGDVVKEQIIDETISTTKLPYTGSVVVVGSIVIVAVIGTLGYVKYKKLKGVK